MYSNFSPANLQQYCLNQPKRDSFAFSKVCIALVTQIDMDIFEGYLSIKPSYLLQETIVEKTLVISSKDSNPCFVIAAQKEGQLPSRTWIVPRIMNQFRAASKIESPQREMEKTASTKNGSKTEE